MAFAEGTTLEQGKQPYKYNGKELDQLHGLNLYDYSARYMDAAIGRFTTVDPLAEKYYSISPYAYVGNNPMKYIDPTGMDWYINDATGELYFNRDISDASTTYKDQAYTRIGDNEMFGDQKDIDERHYDYKSSLVVANYFGYSIKPIQQVIEYNNKKISDSNSSATVETSVIETVVNEKYSLFPIENIYQVRDDTKKTEILGNKFGLAEAVMAIGGAAPIINFTREYSSYLNSSDLIKSGKKGISNSTNSIRIVYNTWESYSSAVGKKGNLIKYKK